jgi:hypothetical protein
VPAVPFPAMSWLWSSQFLQAVVCNVCLDMQGCSLCHAVSYTIACLCATGLSCDTHVRQAMPCNSSLDKEHMATESASTSSLAHDSTGNVCRART